MRIQNRFCHLRDKRQRYLNNISFLVRCKQQRIVPDFIRVSCNLGMSPRITKALVNCHFVLLRAVIQDKRKALAEIEEQLYHTHLEVTRNGTVIEQLFEDNSYQRMELQRDRHKEKLVKKFTLLSQSNKPSTSNATSVSNEFLPVLNLSNKILTKTQLEVLELGPNFANPPRPNPARIVPQLERSVQFSKISAAQKETLRHLLSESLKHNCNLLTKPVLDHGERQALISLQKDDDLVITKADKGGRVVVMDKDRYVSLVEEHISAGPYILLSEDPTDAQLQDVKDGVKSVHSFSKLTKKKVIPSVAHYARLYGLPKVHKPVLSIRPVVSGIGTPAHQAAKELVSVLACTRANNIHTVVNSVLFAKEIRSLIPGNYLMLSFDVVSMFTSVPVDKAIECLRSRLHEFHFTQCEVDEICSLAETCVTQTAFSFNGKLYSQVKGLAMGNPLSPVLCDVYMHYLEEKILNKFGFALWKRYVDDTFVLWDGRKEMVPQLLDELNAMDPNIQFTVEVEDEGRLPFLDVLVKKDRMGFETEVYRKPFAVSLPPHVRSVHPWHQKISAFHYLINRAYELSSTPSALSCELETIEKIALTRGFSSNLISNILRKKHRPLPNTTLQPFNTEKKHKAIIPFFPKVSQKLSSIFKSFDFRIIFQPVGKFGFRPSKDVIPLEKHYGIYSINCRDCNKCYIGQTRRNLKFRVAEHDRYVRKKQLNKSSIAQHCWGENHVFNFQSAKIFHRLSSTEFLNFFEAWHIHSNKTRIVNDSKATPHLSTAWMQLIS